MHNLEGAVVERLHLAFPHVGQAQVLAVGRLPTPVVTPAPTPAQVVARVRISAEAPIVLADTLPHLFVMVSQLDRLSRMARSRVFALRKTGVRLDQ